jgi:hypothetical protein
MHVLPLPFGLALALLPRGEADKLRRREKSEPRARDTIRIRDDIRYPYFNGRGHI